MRERVRDTVLKNGLTVIVSENHSVPMATVQVVVRTGAFTQEPGDEGISHIFEHVLFRAYGKRDRFQRDVSALNGYYNGSTGDEAVDYYITVPSAGTAKALKMLAGLVIAPTFRKSDLFAERAIVMGEFERDASNPHQLLFSAINKKLWSGDEHRRDALGTAKTINGGIGVPRLREIYRRYYVPNNAALVVAGDVNAAEVFAWAAARFGKWKAGPAPEKKWPVPLPAALGESSVIVVGNVHQRLVTVSVQWQGPSVRTDADATYAADVFSQLVNSRVSPMTERLEKSGLVQSANLSYDTRHRGGAIRLSVVMLPANVAEAIPLLRREIDAFATEEYVNAEFLTTAKEERAVFAEYWFGSGAGLAQSISSFWSSSGLDYLRGYGDSLGAVGGPNVLAYVKNFIASRPFVAAALVPSTEEEAVRRVMQAVSEAKPSP